MNKQDLQNKAGEMWDVLVSHLLWYVKDHSNRVELNGYYYGQDLSFGRSSNLYDFKYLYVNDMDELVLHYTMVDSRGKTTEHEVSQGMFTLDDLSLIINKIKE